MSTKTDIINAAFGVIGEDRITSPSAGGVQTATANLFYQRIFDYVLRHRDWNCARFRKVLTRASENYDFQQINEFLFAYTVPSDMLMLRRMTGQSQFPEYSLERIVFQGNTYRLLYTSDATATIVYTARVDPAYLDPMVEDCIIVRLAADLATASRSRDFKLRESLLKEYNYKLTEAIGVDSAESGIDTGRDRTLISVRGSSSGQDNDIAY